jgi:hypothetical protein
MTPINHAWTASNRLMSKAIDVQKRRNAKVEPESKPSPFGFAAHTCSGPPGLGAGGVPAAWRTSEYWRMRFMRRIQKCPHKLDDASPCHCDVHSTNVTQARCKEISMIRRTLFTSILGANAATTSRSTTRSRLKSRRRNCASTMSSRKANAPQKAREATDEIPWDDHTSSQRPRRAIHPTGTARRVGPGPGDAAADAH